MKLRVIIREALQPGYMVARSKIAQLSDALLSAIRNISIIISGVYLPEVMKTKDFRKR